MDPILASLGLKEGGLCEGVHVSIRKSASSDALYHRNITLREADMLVVELVEKLGPPLLIVLTLNKLFKLVLLGQLCHWLSLHRVAYVVVKVVPMLRHIASSDQHLFIRGVVRVFKVHVILLL